MARALALSILCLTACAAPAAPLPPGAPGAPAERELTEVRSVQLRVVQSYPQRLSVTVEGSAPTPGYHSLRLRAFQYIQAPPDGIYDYSLVGTPPANIVAAVVTPVRISETWPLSGNLKGVRIHAQSSTIVAMVGQP